MKLRFGCLLLLGLILMIGMTVGGNKVKAEERMDYAMPFDYYFNTAFDVVQNPYWFSQKHYWSNHRLVWQRVTHPQRSIDHDGGYGQMIKDEFLSSRVLPNIFLHTIGGGDDYWRLKKWYQHHGTSGLWTPLLATLTAYAAHFGNEAYEASDKNLRSTDHIVDLYFFDVVGKVLFANENIAGFFKNEMGLVNWTYIPMYDPGAKSGLGSHAESPAAPERRSSHVFNAGTNYIFRPSSAWIGGPSQIRPFAFVGMQLLAGVSYFLDSEGDQGAGRKGSVFSVAAGEAFTDPLAGKTKLAYGFFYEEKGELAVSLLLNSTEEYRARLNLYPALLMRTENSLRPGVLLGWDRSNNMVLGANISMPIGLGRAF